MIQFIIRSSPSYIELSGEQLMKRRILLLTLLFLMSSFFLTAGSIAATDPENKPVAAQQSSSSETVSRRTAGNSSEAETKAAGAEHSPAHQLSRVQTQGLFSQWLHLLDSEAKSDIGEASVLAYAPEVPADIARSLLEAGTKSGSGFWNIVLRIIVALSIGYLFVFIFRRAAKTKIDKLKELSPPQSEALALLWAGLVRSLPALGGALVLAISAMIAFLILAADIGAKGRMLFQVTLGVILIFKISAIISRIILSPDDTTSRPFEIDQPLIKPLYNAFKYSIAILSSGLLVVNLVRELGARPQSVTWVIFILSTIVIAFYCYLIIYLKKPVASTLLARMDEEDGGWIKRQFASYWHALAILYLAVFWFIWIGQLISGTTQGKGQFIISMLIVPIYFALSHGGRLTISAVIESLDLGKIREDDSADPADELERRAESIEQQKLITAKAFSIFRLVLIAVLATWVLSLWGYDIPFATAAMKALFQSIVVLALALTCWRFASSYIEKKLDEAAPELETAEEEEEDNEFGGAAPRGRIQTLLPMLRKVIGTVLVVMVILIIVSSLGVDIGPLLAGAGVVGLAIGFGAQKLVSDILSGFFFLLDDAFRVGEYIQAGKTRGTVEAITLRNVMLRHHLGMLQVVPHSDLGAITNYMRGGIVIKTPLEFPYDTDIDQVRKIIKKVGVAMLADETLGDDFIQPLKSQGVNEISNSVMIIRVKFTAKPGRQFIIKREAFRRITEALNAKGIYYAHRKVIVDFPEHPAAESSPERQQKLAQAGAAALIAEEQQQKDMAQTESSP